jgi:hypothetical protein
VRGVRPLALLVMALLAVATHERLLERRGEFPADADVLYVPPPRHLEIMSLGYREALADLIWIRALVFSGEHLGLDSIAWVDRYIDGINALAPRFRRPYIWGGVTAVYGGQGAVDRSMVERSIEIYRRGLQEFPEDHEILYPLGMMLAHQVGSTPDFGEEETASMAKEGMELIRRAAAFGADPLVRQYAATVITDYASETLAIQFLETQLLWAEDEKYRRVLRKKLAELVGIEATRSIDRIRTEFFAERARRAPYVPERLYSVIRRDATPFSGRRGPTGGT